MTKSLENKITNTAHSIEPSPEFSKKLWNEIKNTPRQAPAVNPRLRWIPATVIIAIAVTLIVASPQTVMACFRNLFDFLPGIGVVEDNESTLYLSEPVILEQDDVTLTIDQVVADGNKTIVSFQIDNLPVTDSNENTSCFYNNNRLLLPDGTSMRPIGGSVTSSQTSNEARVEFMALPEDISQAVLFASMDSPESTCNAPQEWEVGFSLSTTKPSDMELLPVIDSPAASTAEAKIYLTIDKSVTLEDGYLLFGHTEWTNENWKNVNTRAQILTALDAEGTEIYVKQTDQTDNEFVFKVTPREFAAPLTLQIQNLWIMANFENSSVFSFDAGSDPQIGENWDLNQEVDIEGQKITILNVHAIQEPVELATGDPKKGYAVEIGSAENFNGYIVCEGQEETIAAWGQGRQINDSEKVFETYYEGELPDGLVTCGFQNAQFLLNGDWEIEWQPPQTIQ